MIGLREAAARVGRAYRSAVVHRTTAEPEERVDGATVPAAVDASADVLERVLVENVVPFWGRAVDDRGGFHLAHDAAGRPVDVTLKYLIGQARATWWFARLGRSRWGSPADLDVARHGFRFLVERLWDDEHGGFWWAVPHAGRPPWQEKETLAQLYGLFALVEVAVATGDQEAAALATDLWRRFDAGAHDGVHGGYVEVVARDWTREESLRGGFTKDLRAKTLGTHLRILEVLAPYLSTLGRDDEVAAERLLEVTLVLSVAMGRTPERPGHGRTGPDWRPSPGYVMRQYGHDIELVWMLEDAWEVLGLPPAGLRPLLTDTMDDVLRFGFDHRRGGFLRAGFVGRHAHRTEKDYWAQAEGLLAALRLHRRTGDARYGRCYLRTLDWIVDAQADWVVGDWHERIDHRGRPGGVKSGMWKDPYHQGRALVECLELLRPAPSAHSSRPI